MVAAAVFLAATYALTKKFDHPEIVADSSGKSVVRGVVAGPVVESEGFVLEGCPRARDFTYPPGSPTFPPS
jgi:hypothetical protein